MIVGTLSTGNPDEDVYFEVNWSEVKTFNSLNWTANANYTNHRVHGNTAAPEWTDNDNDQMSFEVYFSAFLGINPRKEVLKMRNLLETRKLCQLIIGTVPMGYWYVKSCPTDLQHIDNRGNILHTKMKVTLLAEPYPDL